MLNLHHAQIAADDERHCNGTTVAEIRQEYARYTCEETGRQSSFLIFAAFCRDRIPGQVRNVGDFFQRFMA